MLSVIVCCSPQVTSKTLKFFFDGVPVIDTAEQITTLDTTSYDTLAVNRVDSHKVTKFYHVPYQEKECAACHNQRAMGEFVESQPELCYQCHEGFGKYKVQHGPVAGGYCTSCHSPHSANNSTLLIRQGQDLCLYCHKPDESFNEEIHDGIDDTACTECHNPHGGESRELLR